MKYIRTCLLCFALCLSSCATVEIQQAPGSFSDLNEALQFITECLEQDAYSKLSGACIGGHKPNAVYLAQHRRPFDMLKVAHLKQPLLERYAKQEFPKTGDKFKLGGHMSELSSSS